MRLLSPITFVAATLGLSLSYGADSQGRFVAGGGFGSLGCTDYLGATATARQQGGFEALPGGNSLNPFMQYVLGFTTGFNMEKDGVSHIFRSFGQDYGLKVLLAIEPWCASNPTKSFDEALFHQIWKLRHEPRK